MRTPAGKDCKFYYEDYFRGRNVQECRLIKSNPESAPWQPRDCFRCPVPEILNANASPDMELTLTIRKQFFGLRRTLHVTARCLRHDIPIADPYVGCPKCAESHPALDLFRQALEDEGD
jgi:hypothetical protein